MNPVDLNAILDVNEVPLCPLCGQPMFNYEIVSIGQVDNVLCLVHYGCSDIEFFDA